MPTADPFPDTVKTAKQTWTTAFKQGVNRAVLLSELCEVTEALSVSCHLLSISPGQHESTTFKHK